MRGRKFAVLAVGMLAGLVAAGVSLAGDAVATGRPAVPSTGQASGTGQAPSAGMVRLVAYADSDGSVATAVLTGAIGDLGTAVSVEPDGTIDPNHDAEVSLALSHGSFRIDIAAVDRTFLGAIRRATFQPSNNTCSGSVSVTGTAPIVAGSGTGGYRGIHGGFQLTMTLAEVDARTSDPTAPCGPTGALLGEAVVTDGSGAVAFG